MNSLESLFIFILVSNCILCGRSHNVSFSLCWLKDSSLQRQNDNFWLNLTSLKSIGSAGKVTSVTVSPLVENTLRLRYNGGVHEWTLTIIPKTKFIKVTGRHKPTGVPVNATTDFLKTLSPSEVFACENGTLFLYQEEGFFFAVGHSTRLPVMLGSRSPFTLQVWWVVNQSEVFHRHRVRLYQAQLGSFTTHRTHTTSLNHHQFSALDSCSRYIICVEIKDSHSIICISTITDPDVPVDFVVRSWNSSSISLAWDCPLNRRYSLFLLSAFYLNGTDNIQAEQKLWLRDNQFTYTLADLQPCSRVQFGLQTVCQAGVETRYSTMVMSDGNSVHSSMKVLRQSLFSSDSYTLSWEVGTFSSISMFRVYHEGALQGTTLTTSSTVGGLLPCHQYQARVEALCGESVVMNSKTLAAHTGPRGASELRYHPNDSTVSWTPSSTQQPALTFLYKLSTEEGSALQSSRVNAPPLPLPGLTSGKSYVLSLWEECHNQWKSNPAQLSFEGVNSSLIQARAARPAQDFDPDFETIGLIVVLPWTIPVELQDDKSEPAAKIKALFAEKMQHELLKDSGRLLRVELTSFQPAEEHNGTKIHFVFFNATKTEEKGTLTIEEQGDYIRSLKKPNITVKDGLIYWNGPNLCASKHSLCPQHSLCISTLDSFTCVCQHGYYDISAAIGSPAASQPVCKVNGLFSQCRSKLMIGGVAKSYLTKQIGGGMEVKLNNGQCKVNHSDTIIFFRASRRVSECGTEKQVNKTHIRFENTLTVIPSKEKSISRRRDLKVVWKCIYRRHYVRNAQVSVDMDWFSSISLVVFNSSLPLSLTMTLHSDQTYSSSYTDAVHLGPDDTLFFEVALQAHAYFVPDLLLQVDSCWATETTNPQDLVQAKFLQDGCPVDTTFRWHMMVDQRSRFSLQLFTMPEGLPLYFHCLTNICGREDNCTKNCRDPVRSKRSVVTQEEDRRRSRRGAVVSAGPLILHSGRNSSVQVSHLADHMIILSTVAALIGFLGLTVLSVIATKAIMMYYLQLRRE